MIKYKRILLKLSGEALMGENQYGLDPGRLEQYTSQIKKILQMGVQTGIVVGGGNIFRGLKGTMEGFDRISGDYMGMLATVINGLSMKSWFEKQDVRATLFTAIPMEPVGIRFTREKALESLRNNEAAIFTFGTGNPFFTTDTAAALRAVETGADVLIKGTRVDGVYSEDPERVPGAEKFSRISYDEVLRKKLRVMDLTAITLCRENNLPVVVCNMNIPGSIGKIVSGESVGTMIQG